MNKLEYHVSTNQYEALLPDNRVLIVDGNAFIEAVRDRIHVHPVFQLDEYEKQYRKQEEALLQDDIWVLNALEVPSGQTIEEQPFYCQYDAFIVYQD